jgi:hypothetical protein
MLYKYKSKHFGIWHLSPFNYTDFMDGWFLQEYLGWPWSEHAHIPISQIVYFCESYSPFHVCLTICASHILCTQTWKGLQLSQKSTIREIGIICACSDHGQPRYQVWIKSNKRPCAEDKLLGVSTHNLTEALKAQSIGADFVVISPVQATHKWVKSGFLMIVPIYAKVSLYVDPDF